MLTVVRDRDGERVTTVQIHEAVIDAEVVRSLASVLNDVEHGGIENFVLHFSGGSDSVAGDFRLGRQDAVPSDTRFFARWDETLSRISRLKTKTFAAYDGRVGAAAVHVGLVMDLRLASVQAQLSLGSLADGPFPGMGAYWLRSSSVSATPGRSSCSVRTCPRSERPSSDWWTLSKTPSMQPWMPRSRPRAR